MFQKSCKDCGRDFCSQCVLQPSRRPSSASSRDYQCKSCQILLTGTFSRSQLLKWKIKDLKALLTKQNINTSKCKEKSDLIDLLFTNYGNTPNLYRRGTEQEILVQQMTVSSIANVLILQTLAALQKRPRQTAQTGLPF